MAEYTDDYPAEATSGARPQEVSGEAALAEALDEHGERLARALERTDEAVELLETALLVIAAADEEDVEQLTDSSANLIAAAEGLSTAEASELAGDVGENADDLAEALDVILELQRENQLEALAELGSTLSALEMDEETVRGLNVLLGAVGEAESEAEPIGFVGVLRGLRSSDARAGLGYLLALLQAVGRRLRQP